LAGSLGLMRNLEDCSTLATLTTLLKVWPAVRFWLPGRNVPCRVWQVEQIGVKIAACSWVRVVCAGAAALATVTVSGAEVVALPSTSVTVAVRVTLPLAVLVVSQE